MRIGRVVYLLSSIGIKLATATALKEDGLNYKTSNGGQEEFAPKGEAHKVRWNFEDTVRNTIGIERPKMAFHAGDVVLVKMLADDIYAAQVAKDVRLNAKKVPVVFVKDGEVENVPIDTVTKVHNISVEEFMQKHTDVALGGGSFAEASSTSSYDQDVAAEGEGYESDEEDDEEESEEEDED